MTRRVVVGISGASGAIYAWRLLEMLRQAAVEIHLVISPAGQRLLHDELGMEVPDLEVLRGQTGLPENPSPTLVRYDIRDMGAPISSGSFQHDGMVIIPCSSNTLAAVAHGLQQNLMHRAAYVCLKERRRLILVHRETPLTLTDIRNMAAVTEAGAIVLPACPAFYMLPRRIEDLVDYIVGRVLDLLNVPHELAVRWDPQHPPAVPPPSHRV